MTYRCESRSVAPAVDAASIACPSCTAPSGTSRLGCSTVRTSSLISEGQGRAVDALLEGPEQAPHHELHVVHPPTAALVVTYTTMVVQSSTLFG
jgi:hypothetical protein